MVQTKQRGRGPESRQGDVAGSGHKMALRPAQRRGWAGQLQEGFEVSMQRALQMMAMSYSSYGYTVRARDSLAARPRMREISSTRVLTDTSLYLSGCAGKAGGSITGGSIGYTREKGCLPVIVGRAPAEVRGGAGRSRWPLAPTRCGAWTSSVMHSSTVSVSGC